MRGQRLQLRTEHQRVAGVEDGGAAGVEEVAGVVEAVVVGVDHRVLAAHDLDGEAGDPPRYVLAHDTLVRPIREWLDANPIGIGQMEFFRPQLITVSSVVVMTLCDNRLRSSLSTVSCHGSSPLTRWVVCHAYGPPRTKLLPFHE